MNLESIQEFLINNIEYSWMIIMFFAFAESFLITGIFISSAILFSICIFLYNMGALSIFGIVPVAMIGAHIGDVSSFFLGKTLGPQILASKALTKRQKNNKKSTKVSR
jgi:membrane-associated protein